MKSSHESESFGTRRGSRRRRLQYLPYAMELAKLAATLKPDLAGGTPEEQQEALSLARSLFDLAVKFVDEADAVDIAVNLEEKHVAGPADIELSDASAPVLFFSDEADFDKLREYLKKRGIKPPKFSTGRWKAFLDENSQRHRRLGRFIVRREVVDEEILRIKAAEALRKKNSRQAMRRTGREPS